MRKIKRAGERSERNGQSQGTALFFVPDPSSRWEEDYLVKIPHQLDQRKGRSCRVGRGRGGGAQGHHVLSFLAITAPSTPGA